MGLLYFLAILDIKIRVLRLKFEHRILTKNELRQERAYIFDLLNAALSSGSKADCADSRVDSLTRQLARLDMSLRGGRQLSRVEQRYLSHVSDDLLIPDEDLLLIFSTRLLTENGESLEPREPQWFLALIVVLLSTFILAKIIATCLLWGELRAYGIILDLLVLIGALTPLIAVGYFFDLYMIRPMLAYHKWQSRFSEM